MKLLRGLSVGLFIHLGQRRDAVFLKGWKTGEEEKEGEEERGGNGEVGGVVHHGDGPRPDGRYRYHY